MTSTNKDYLARVRWSREFYKGRETGIVGDFSYLVESSGMQEEAYVLEHPPVPRDHGKDYHDAFTRLLGCDWVKEYAMKQAGLGCDAYCILELSYRRLFEFENQTDPKYYLVFSLNLPTLKKEDRPLAQLVFYTQSTCARLHSGLHYPSDIQLYRDALPSHISLQQIAEVIRILCCVILNKDMIATELWQDFFARV